MKVTFCTREYDDLSGGQNTWLSRFVPELKRRGIKSRVLCFTLSAEKELPTVRSLRTAGIECAISSDKEKRYTEQRIQWILEQVAANPTDVFVANMVIPAAYYAGRYLREAGIPVVGICHVGTEHFLYPGLLNQFVFGRTDYQVSALVCISKYQRQDVLRRYPKRIWVRHIPCGVSIPIRSAKRPNGPLRLAYVGRLAEEAKRISEVTHALCRAVREVPDTEAFIYGDGEERAVVERIIRDEGEGLPIHLIGFVENNQIQKHLLNCHVVVLLSDWEGLPVSVMEGMACGLVPIGFRHAHGGMPELIEDGVTGILVDDRGDSFVAAVRRLRQDRALWLRLSRAARARAGTEYSEKTCAARWQELLSDLANSSVSRKPIRIPKTFNFPPVHPALAVLDERAPRPHQQLLRKARHLVNHLLG